MKIHNLLNETKRKQNNKEWTTWTKFTFNENIIRNKWNDQHKILKYKYNSEKQLDLAKRCHVTSSSIITVSAVFVTDLEIYYYYYY